MRIFCHELKTELLLYSRSRELAFFTFFLPVIFFVLLGSVYGGSDRIKGYRAPDYLLTGMLGYGVAATAFSGLAIVLVIRRESGVLKRLRATPLPPWIYIAAVLLTGLSLTGCVYRIDIQQGNLLEQVDIDQIQVGMTRSQVQFLLGTPMVADSFHRDRWDYAYYFRQGRSRDVERRWLVVHFDGDRVARVERDLTLAPAS